MTRFATTVLATCIGALAVLYSKDSPAPPPPNPNCTSGVATSLALEFGTPPNVPVNSHLSGLFVQAFDAMGNPLRGIPITFTAPSSGPSGTFNILTDAANDTYIPTPNPLTTTLTTSSTCDAAVPLFIANGMVGNYQITAASGSLPVLSVSIANVPTGSAILLAPSGTNGQIAHVGTPFQQLVARTEGSAAEQVAGLPVSFAVPTSGPSGFFPGASTTVTALTDAFGRAYAPILTANATAGYFNASVSSPGATSIKIGPLVNGAGTVTTIERYGTTPSATVFGHPVNLVASVQFTGFPGSGTFSGPLFFPHPGGNVVLKSDGNVIASSPVDDFAYELGACSTCADLTLRFIFESVTLPFGTHQLTAEYQSNGQYDSSPSVAIAQTVLPEFAGPTANVAVQSMAGVTGGAPETWVCNLSTAGWTSLANAGVAPPPAYAFPFGLFRYRIDGCVYTGGTFDPSPGFPATQILVLQFTQPLPPGAVFLSYGPTSDNHSPHWYQLPSKVDGSAMSITLEDGAPGDDDLTINNIIVGLGGPAASSDQQPIPTVSAYGLATLSALILVAGLLGYELRRRRSRNRQTS